MVPLDPHVLHEIIKKIRQQMRCPQCGEDVPVEFGDFRLVEHDAALLELQCGCCGAYMVLQASISGLEHISVKKQEQSPTINASSQLSACEDELKKIQENIAKSGGSFSSMFGTIEEE